MTGWAVLGALLVGLLVNEVTEVSPWLARRLVGWSAQVRYAGSPRADVRAEELAALINERPGKLFKLLTAMNFAAASVAQRVRHRTVDEDAPYEPPPAYSPLDGLMVRRVLPLEDEPSQMVARYLFPTERFRGAWRRHLVKPLADAGYGAAVAIAGVVWFSQNSWTVAPEQYGLPVPEITVAPTAGQIAGGFGVYLLWRVVGWWWFNRFVLTNKRLMMVRGVVLRRVMMAPLLRATDLSFRQSLLGRAFNYGTLTLRAVGLFHPMRRIPYLPNPNELYLRAVEEMYEPAAVEARMGQAWPEAEDEIREAVALLLVAAMGTDVWPLVRDTFAEVMREVRVGVAAQLDSEAVRLAESDPAGRDDVRLHLAAEWQQRLVVLGDPHLLRSLDQVGRRIALCLPEERRLWARAHSSADDPPAEEAVAPPQDGAPESELEGDPVPSRAEP